MSLEIIFEKINKERNKRNFISIEQTIALVQNGNILTDPFSVLISKNAVIGSGNVFFPGVIIESCGSLSSVTIGNGNVFYPQSFLLADNGGYIAIGNLNHFEGGVSIKSNVTGSHITIGDHGRYLNGVQVIGKCNLGSGTQVIGNVTVQNCVLEEGESFLCDNPDLRGGLIKGSGLARNLTVGKGKVVDNTSKFDSCNIQEQSLFHPNK